MLILYFNYQIKQISYLKMCFSGDCKHETDYMEEEFN